jgi:NADH-quinone oxidoreductase subunit C
MSRSAPRDRSSDPPDEATDVSAAGVAERVRAAYPDVVVARDEASVSLGREDLLRALESFRADPALRLDFLSSVTATDWPGRDPRFWLVYELSSNDLRHRLRVKVGLHEDDVHVPSVTGLFPTADWHERETFDFYGVVFDGHPDLRRILLPDDWEGWPLRKTEELGGVDTRYHGAFIPPVDRRIP